MEPEFSLPRSQATEPVPILSQKNPVRFLPVCFNNYRKTIVLSAPKSCTSFLSFRFTHQNLLHISPFLHVCHMPQPSRTPLFIILTICWGVQIVKLYVLKFSLFSWGHETLCRRCAMNKIMYSVYSYLCLFSLNNYCRHARVMCLWFQSATFTWNCNQPLSEGRKLQIPFSSSRHDSKVV